jgi:DNA-binding transcriptional LysR family regulator
MLKVMLTSVKCIICVNSIAFLHTMTASIAQLRNFLALADSGSFTRAADQNRRSQAAFSRSISVLENNLGVSLVDRVGHRNALTPIGRTVLAHARQVVAQTDELLQVVQHHASGNAGHVRIGLSPTPSALLTRPLLRFAAQHAGGMRITVSQGPLEQQVNALRERRLDALVMDLRSVQHSSVDLQVEKVGEFTTGLLCRKGHPLTQKDTLRLEDLLHYPIASTEVSDTVAHKLVERFGPQAHPASLISLRCEDIASLLEVVSNSDAVYAGMVASAQHLLLRKVLVQLPFATQGLESQVAWVQRTNKAPNPVLDEVHALVLAELRPYANRD